MKILNAYCGIGGNRKLWGNDHEITAIEYKPEIAAIYQDFFPNDKVIVADAHEYLLEHFAEFDFIWSSPPCPTHSKARYGLGFHGGKAAAVYPDMRLYQEVILLKTHFKGKWCVENVIAYYEPLIIPRTAGRHWYWSNFYFPAEFDYYEFKPSGITQNKTGNVRTAKLNDLEQKYGFDLSKYKGVDKRLLLRNCVEPELGKHVLDWSQKIFSPTKSLF